MIDSYQRYFKAGNLRVENIRLVCLLDLTADFEVKTNVRAKLEIRAV